MHINDRYDMSCFNGTPFEGLTYLQLRRRMSPQQVSKLKSLNKRERKLAGFIKSCDQTKADYMYGMKTAIRA